MAPNFVVSCSQYGNIVMRLAGRNILADFVGRHADIRTQIEAWVSDVENAAWRSPAELMQRYPRASYVGEARWIFNIKGNDYRLLARVSFRNQAVVVIDIGTHAEYDVWVI